MRVRVRFIAIIAGVAAAALGLMPASSASPPAKKKFTGAPILVAATGSITVAGTGRTIPEIHAGVQARAAAINDAGGLRDANGKTHKVKVFVCDIAGDPNVGQACAREAESKGAVASLGFGPGTTGQVFPIFDAAGIPSIGTIVAGLDAGTLKSSFPLANPAGLGFASVELLVSEGATTIGRMYTSDIANAEAGVTRFSNSIRAAGAKVGPSIGIARDQADLAPFIAQVTPETDGMVVGGASLVQIIQEITGLRAAGYKGKFALPGLTVNEELLTSLGKDGNGVLVPHLYPVPSTDLPAMKQYRSDMRAFDKKVPLNDTSLNSWLSMWVFERVAATVPTIDRALMMAALGDLTSFDMGGITPPLTTTVPSQITGLPFTRVFNQAVTWGVIKKGKIVSIDTDFHNPYTGETIPNVALNPAKKES